MNMISSKSVFIIYNYVQANKIRKENDLIQMPCIYMEQFGEKKFFFLVEWHLGESLGRG